MDAAHEWFGWGALALLLTAAAIVILVWRRRRRLGDTGTRHYCPGPSSVWVWLDPRDWFVRRGCWYDLTGLPADEHGVVRCPECGTQTPPHRWRDCHRRWRIRTLVATCVVVAAASFATPWYRTGHWYAGVPTIFLVLDELAGRRWQTKSLRHEVYDRVMARGVGPVSAWLLSRKLVHDLRDDDIRWNADRAADMLPTLWPTARTALEAALDDDDRQARIIAAALLRSACPNDPSDALLAACIDDLRNDAQQIDFWTLRNAREAAEYLCGFPRRTEALLRTALHSDDAQQRLLAAAVAGFSGLDSLVDEAAPLLVVHLGGDDIQGNAKLAVGALFRFGPRVTPYLVPSMLSRDPQASGLARAIMIRLQQTDLERRTPLPMPRITDMTRDAVMYLTIDDCMRDIASLVPSDEP